MNCNITFSVVEQLFFDMDSIADEAIGRFVEINKKQPTRIECNRLTMKMWEKYNELKYPIVYCGERNVIERDSTRACPMFEGISIIENNHLKDGVISVM